jgi:endoplasmic reticulum-Golgi intermediate compartment protein 3
MSFLTSRFKKFDVHIKTVDGVSQQTTLGALFTLLTVAITMVLLYSEINFYLTRENVHHMVLDQNTGQETVRLDFDLEFHAIPCQGN